MVVDYKNAERVCKELKSSIDFINQEIAKLEGSKATLNNRVVELNDTCNQLGVDPDELETIIEQGQTKLDSLTRQAEDIIDNINSIKKL